MSKQFIECFFLSFFGCFFKIVLSQDINTAQQKYIEDIVETISDRSDETADLSLLLDNLSYYFMHPININSATSDQLSELYLLNDFQIAVIIDYRKKNGNINTISELLYLPGFRQPDVDLLENFIVFERPDVKVSINKQRLSNSKHQLIKRYQRVLENQEGYKILPDSVLELNPEKSRFLGSPDKLYLKYSSSYGNLINAGITMEKDAGEEFFKGSNGHGFDFYSAYISYNNDQGMISNITLGDYLIRWGQGLLIWNGYSLGKSLNMSAIASRSFATRGNSSVDENRFLRGVSFTVKKSRFRYTAFYSLKRIDATIAGDELFTGFVQTGYHATPSDLRKEKSLTQTVTGSNFQYSGNRLKIGLNSYYLLFGKTLKNGNDMYKIHSFSGKDLMGVSFDYKYLAGKIQVFGETAYSNYSIATLNGILLVPRPEIQIGIIYRYYDEGYYSFFANAFSESSGVSNENGLFLGGNLQFAGYRIKLYGDVFSFPWLKYRINAPSEGYEYHIEINKKYNNSDLDIRYKHQEKPENYPDGKKLAEIKILSQENVRLNVTYFAGEIFRFQNRVEIKKVFFHKETNHYGFLGFQDVVFLQKSVPIEYFLRIAYFNASVYNARIYAYEKDLLYSFSSCIYFGRGWRFAAMIKWEVAKFLTFWLKISQSLYPGETEVGSGLNTIYSNHKTEVKLQIIAKF